jgi:hypothetical protein
VDVEAGHQSGADIGSDAIEGLEGAGDELGFSEMSAEDEHLDELVVLGEGRRWMSYHVGGGMEMWRGRGWSLNKSSRRIEHVK